MRKYFPELVPTDHNHLRNLVSNCFIVLDTNVLLYAYRLGDADREAWLKWIEQVEIADKLFIPYQVALEFTRNRTDLVNEWSSSYRRMADQIEADMMKARNSLKEKFPPRKYPFIDFDIIDAKFYESQENIKELILQSTPQIPLVRSEDPDPIYDRLDVLISKNLGKKFDHKTLDEIYKEGRFRYERKIPPGYEDSKTKSEPDKFGDFVIWKEVIKYAKENNKPLLFVTNDLKQDWFEQDKPRRARADLTTEFYDLSGQEAMIWSLDKFIKDVSALLSAHELTDANQVNTSVVNHVNTPTVTQSHPAPMGILGAIGQPNPPFERKILEINAFPQDKVDLLCFDFRMTETLALALDPIGKYISFDPSLLEPSERLALEQISPQPYRLIAVSGGDMHNIINQHGAAYGSIDGETYRVWLLPDKYTSSRDLFYPAALIPVN